MPAIGITGTEVRVTPSDEIQIVRAPGDHEFIDDRSPFSMRVEGTLDHEAHIIGVYGSVTSGHERYFGLIATLLVRLDNSDWRRDNRSAAQFKVGKSLARPNGRYPVCLPEGTDIDGFPFIVRYGSLDSRSGDEIEVNSAMVAPPEN